jgi:hypothetical protein
MVTKPWYVKKPGLRFRTSKSSRYVNKIKPDPILHPSVSFLPSASRARKKNRSKRPSVYFFLSVYEPCASWASKLWPGQVAVHKESSSRHHV